MILKFKSKFDLRRTVEHNVRLVGLSTYESTVRSSGLTFSVNRKGLVSLVGGHSKFIFRGNLVYPWIRGQYHQYEHAVLLGSSAVISQGE